MLSHANNATTGGRRRGRRARARARHAQVAGYRGKFQRRILDAKPRMPANFSSLAPIVPLASNLLHRVGSSNQYSVLPGESAFLRSDPTFEFFPPMKPSNPARAIHRARASCSSIHRPSRSPRDAIIMRRCGTSGASLRPPSSRFRHQRAITMFVTLSGS